MATKKATYKSTSVDNFEYGTIIVYSTSALFFLSLTAFSISSVRCKYSTRSWILQIVLQISQQNYSFVQVIVIEGSSKICGGRARTIILFINLLGAIEESLYITCKAFWKRLVIITLARFPLSSSRSAEALVRCFTIGLLEAMEAWENSLGDVSSENKHRLLEREWQHQDQDLDAQHD